MRDAARIALLVLVLLGGVAAWAARTFVVGFPTDPLGPRAFPWFASALLVVFGTAALRVGRPGAPGAVDGEDPPPGGERAPPPGGAASEEPASTGTEGTGRQTEVRSASLRPLLAVLSFVGFALLLEPLGFVVATTLEFAVLARLFRSRILPGLAVGLAFAVLSFLLFVQLLGLPLPLGIWMGST